MRLSLKKRTSENFGIDYKNVSKNLNTATACPRECFVSIYCVQNQNSLYFGSQLVNKVLDIFPFVQKVYKGISGLWICSFKRYSDLVRSRINDKPVKKGIK